MRSKNVLRFFEKQKIESSEFGKAIETKRSYETKTETDSRSNQKRNRFWKIQEIVDNVKCEKEKNLFNGLSLEISY